MSDKLVRTRQSLFATVPAMNGASCQQTAEVKAVHSSFLEVTVTSSACAGCNGRCLGFSSSEKTVRVSRSLADRHVTIRSGDLIRLSVPRATLIGLSSLVYLLPVVLMLLFAIVSDVLLQGSELISATAGLIGLVSGAVVGRIVAGRYNRSIRSQISVTAGE